MTEMLGGLILGAILVVLIATLVHSWIEDGEENGIVDLREPEDAEWDDEEEE